MSFDAVKIGAMRYEVRALDASEASDECRWGDCNHRLGRIRIVEGLPPQKWAATVLHELLHAVFHDIGIDWSPDDEERMVERLTPRIAAFLADNPEQVGVLVAVLGGEA